MNDILWALYSITTDFLIQSPYFSLLDQTFGGLVVVIRNKRITQITIIFLQLVVLPKSIGIIPFHLIEGTFFFLFFFLQCSVWGYVVSNFNKVFQLVWALMTTESTKWCCDLLLLFNRNYKKKRIANRRKVGFKQNWAFSLLLLGFWACIWWAYLIKLQPISL